MKITGTKPIYEEIASYYEKMISLGIYPEGSYLPSVREVSLENKINPNTVQRGYSLLVSKGIVLSIPKKGYLVQNTNNKINNNQLLDSINQLLDSGYTIEQIKKALEDIERNQKND